MTGRHASAIQLLLLTMLVGLAGSASTVHADRRDPSREPSLELLLKAQDPGFPGRARERDIGVASTRRELSHWLWLKGEPAPLVFIIPGIGAHRNSSTPVAVAEMAVQRGYSAVTVSSPFHEEFLVGFNRRTVMLETLTAIELKGKEALEIREEPHRGPLLERISQSSLRRYADGLTIPHYLSRPGQRLDREGMAEPAGLRALERTLMSDARIHVATDANDFLLDQEDLTWLRETLGERLIVFPDGGPLGDMHLPPAQEVVFAGLEGTDD